MISQCRWYHGGRSSGRRRLGGASLLACIAAGLLLAGCGGATHAASSTTVSGHPQQGGTLTIAASTEPQTLDPSICACDPASEQTIVQIFDELVEFPNGTSTTPMPGLAQSWTISADHLTYTFHLRNARFSNGQPVTAEDVRFSLNRLISPSIDASEAGLFSSIGSIAAPDPHSVVVHLKHVYAPILWYLGHPAASIYPMAYFQKVGAQGFAAHPIGSGAYEFVSWEHGQRLVLKRNPHYWRSGLPHFTNVVVNFVPESNARLLDVRSGSVDVATEIPFTEVASIRKVSGYRVDVKEVGTMDSLPMNEHVAPLNELVVRQALNYATPKAALQRIVYGGLGIVQNSALPIMRYWDSSVPAYPYDIQKARELLARSSKPHGFSLTLTIVGTDAPSRSIAQLIQQAWGQIGIHVTIVNGDYATVASDWSKEEYDVLFYPGLNTDVPVDDELAAAFLQQSAGEDAGFTHYSNPEVNALINEAASTLNESTRTALFRKIQQLDTTDPPWVFLLFAPERTAVRTNVGGFSFTPMLWFRIESLYRIAS